MGRKRIHFENKCSYCGRNFKRRYNLVVHERVHNGDKPYACTLEDCRRRFAYKSSLDSHMVSHRRAAENSAEVQKGQHECSWKGKIDEELRKLEAELVGDTWMGSTVFLADTQNEEHEKSSRQWQQQDSSFEGGTRITQPSSQLSDTEDISRGGMETPYCHGLSYLEQYHLSAEKHTLAMASAAESLDDSLSSRGCKWNDERTSTESYYHCGNHDTCSTINPSHCNDSRFVGSVPLNNRSILTDSCSPISNLGLPLLWFTESAD